MISFLRGRLIELRLTSLVLDLNGIGYEVIVAPEIANSLTIGAEVELFTSLVVREDSWTLFGFRSPDARTLFEELQGVTGIGPKVAHALIAFFRPEELRLAIANGEASSLERVPGVGKKVASRIILELKDKYGDGRLSAQNVSGKWRDNLMRALTGLGYSNREAEHAIDLTIAELEVDPANVEISALLRQALARARDSR